MGHATGRGALGDSHLRRLRALAGESELAGLERLEAFVGEASDLEAAAALYERDGDREAAAAMLALLEVPAH